MSFDPFIFEKQARDEGHQRVAGVDEAGRGPLAGPVVAAACTLFGSFAASGLDDSKKLTPKKRDVLFEEIIDSSECAYGIGIVEADTIDQINILQATFRAMILAVEHMPVKPDFLLIDGNHLPQIAIPARAIVRGDSLSMSIMAASVLAKVTRDRIMVEIDRLYPLYKFAKHKGYGTKDHLASLEKYGFCSAHRRSFEPVKSMVCEC